MKEQLAPSPSYDVFSRLKSISPTLYALDRKPLIPPEYSFPLERMEELLSKYLGKEVSLKGEEKEWVTSDQITKKKKENDLRELSCSVFGISTPLSLLFSNDSLSVVLAELLQSDLTHIKMQPALFLKAFESFFFAQVVACVKEAVTFEKMEIQLKEPKESIPYEGCFLYRYTMHIGKATSSFLISLPAPFLDKLHDLPQSKEFQPSQWLINLPFFPISVEAARVHIPLSQLQKIQPGDVIFVDFPFFIPGSERARVILTYRGIPLFRAKVKNGVIKLLEMSHNQQAFQPISQTPLSILAKTIKEPAMDPLNKKLPSTQKNTPAEAKKTLPLESQDDSQLDFSEDEQTQELETYTDTGKEKPTHPVSFNDLPLLVIVQLKELSMTLEQLQSLQPGNLLDLDIHPEKAIVQLTIQGHTIGEGDLILIGDKVGVRIRVIGTP
jgi:type III secretion system YscQ/HrcQ family protein